MTLIMLSVVYLLLSRSRLRMRCSSSWQIIDADWGNKTTMMMNGYKRFGVKNYFPIKVDGNSVDTRDQTAYWATQNNSFTKQTRERAVNALIVDDIFVYSQSMLRIWLHTVHSQLHYQMQ